MDNPSLSVAGASARLFRKHLILLALILVLAAVVRFNPFLEWRVYHFDEYFSWRTATSETLGQLLQRTGNDANPPLFYLLSRWWMGLFGESVVSMRKLSAICGVMTVVTTWWLARLWGDKEEASRRDSTALFAAALMAVSLPLVAVSVTARMYSLQTLLFCSASVCLLAAVRKPGRWRWWAAYAVFATALVYNHTLGPILVLAHGFWLAGELLRPSRAGRRGVMAVRGFCALGLVLAAYAPWVPSLYNQASMVTTSYWIPPLSWDHLSALVFQWVSWPIWYISRFDPLWYENVVYGLLLLLVVLPWRRTPAEWLVFWSVMLHAVVLSGVYLVTGQSILSPRYLIPLIPLTAAPVANAVMCIPSAIARRLVVAGAVAAMVAVTVIGVGKHTGGDGGQLDAVRALVAASEPSEPVVARSYAHFLSCRYYLDQLGRVHQPCYAFVDSEVKHGSNYGHVPLAAAVGSLEILYDLKAMPGLSPRIWVDIHTAKTGIPPYWRHVETLRRGGAMGSVITFICYVQNDAP